MTATVKSVFTKRGKVYNQTQGAGRTETMGFKEVFVDIRTATREQMQQAFALEREGILQRLAQIKTDVESYNDHWNKGERLEFVFDFTDDVKERYLANWISKAPKQ